MVSKEEREKLISQIICDAVGVENALDLIILDYTIVKDKQDWFKKNILNDEYFNVSLKLKIIFRLEIIKKFQINQKLERIFQIRNLVAHSNFLLKLEMAHRSQGNINLLELFEEFKKIQEEILSKIGPLVLKAVSN